jgi:dUTP pyrophosphatase
MRNGSGKREASGMTEKERKMAMLKKLKVMLSKGAYMPTRAHEDDGGLDLYSPEDTWLFERDHVTIDTGVHVEIPKGYVGFLKSKSGLNVNFNITSEGVIDSGYTGSIRVKLYNHGNTPLKIMKGMKISQLVILPIVTPVCVEVFEMKDTERGTGGFGSTGA